MLELVNASQYMRPGRTPGGEITRGNISLLCLCAEVGGGGIV